MAKEDYVVADRPFNNINGTDGGLTAHDKVARTVWSNPDDDAATAAAAAGVSRAAYIDYAAALNTFQSRTDIETLADRRSREIASDFASNDFMRTDASDTAPTPGSVNGVADASK